MCDGYLHCSDGSDEFDCDSGTSGPFTMEPTSETAATKFETQSTSSTEQMQITTEEDSITTTETSTPATTSATTEPVVEPTDDGNKPILEITLLFQRAPFYLK